MCGMGVVSRMVVTRMPAFAMARIADSRPPPGPLTRTSHCCIPASWALRAASYAACWAAKGVPFLKPRNPRAPADDCAIRLPSRSVIEIIVLLKEAAMCATPTGTFFFSFLRKTFFFPPAFAIYIPSNGQYFPISEALLLAGRFFLGDRRTARSFARARVGVRALSPYGE